MKKSALLRRGRGKLPKRRETNSVMSKPEQVASPAPDPCTVLCRTRRTPFPANSRHFAGQRRVEGGELPGALLWSPSGLQLLGEAEGPAGAPRGRCSGGTGSRHRGALPFAPRTWPLQIRSQVCGRLTLGISEILFAAGLGYFFPQLFFERIVVLKIYV